MTKNATPAKGGAMSASHALNLSFVTAKLPKGSGLDCWNAEPSGNYVADCAKGHALGREYLDFIGRHSTSGNALVLGWIVASMIQKAAETGRCFGGLEVGFFKEVNGYVMASARLIPLIDTAA